MLELNEVLDLAYHYVVNMAKAKRYTAQTIAINNVFKFESIFGMSDWEDYLLNYEEFSKKHVIENAKDFVYKKDSFSMREMYIISPEYYLYYTFQVFKLVNGYFNNKDFSSINVKVFYSGKISLDKSKVIEHSDFNSQYSDFLRIRKTYSDSRVLSIDIQNFFNSININSLIDKLKKFSNQSDYQISVNNLENFFLKNNFVTLPQFHHSIASSFLSQIYLMNFTQNLSEILLKEGAEAVRFVDDLYIKLPKGKFRKTINKMLNKITILLWEDNLNINSNKTKLLTASEFKKESDIIISMYDDNSFTIEKIISVKVDELLANDGSRLLSFFECLNQTKKSYGLDMKDYLNFLNEYISIEGDHTSKVIKHLIFSNKWKSLSNEALLTIVYKYEYILFCPNEFSLLYIFCRRHLKEKDKFFIELAKEPTFTVRESIASINYIIQKEQFKDIYILKEKLGRVNQKYIEYLEKYL